MSVLLPVLYVICGKMVWYRQLLYYLSVVEFPLKLLLTITLGITKLWARGDSRGERQQELQRARAEIIAAGGGGERVAKVLLH